MFPDFLKTKEKLQKMLDYEMKKAQLIHIWDHLLMFLNQ